MYVMEHAKEAPLIYIDDDEDDRFLFKQAIDELGLSIPIHSFSHGLDALHYLKTATVRPLLILCDLNMPEISGVELRHLIKKNDDVERLHIPFVFFTTMASPEQIRQAYESYMQGIFTKASVFSELKDQLLVIVQYWKSSIQPEPF